MGISLCRALFIGSFIFFAHSAFAAGDDASSSQPNTHNLEAVAETGLAWPGYTIQNPSNVSTGINTVGSLLYVLGRGCSLGLFVDWTRLPWTPQAGPPAHVDTILYGPEFRGTFNRRGLILPHVYLGWGLQSIYPSRKSQTDSVKGSMGIRAGVGVDVRVLAQLRLGVSAGFVAGTSSSSGAEVFVPGDPGIPDGGLSIWALRIGGRGEFL